MIPKIKVIGLGGAGCNTVSRMMDCDLPGIELIGINTDAQALKQSRVVNKILIGENATQGLGAGMDYVLGEKAAQESSEQITQALDGADLVFLTAGLGGGSGTSAIGVAGDLAKNYLNILTIAVCTLPFSFEGAFRRKVAGWGLENLKNKVDSFLLIPNDKILKAVDPETSISNAFLKCDEVLIQAVLGISDLLSRPGIISVDFADLISILKNSGKALFGVGISKGEDRVVNAVNKALKSALLDAPSGGAKGILFNISGRDLILSEANAGANFIKKAGDSNTKIIFGVSEDRGLEKGTVKVTVIATGIE